MRKKSSLSELFEFAGKYKWLSVTSVVLSSASALLTLVPFFYIWIMIRDVLEVAPDFSKAANLATYGWKAVLWAVAAILVYSSALICSHFSAFRIASAIRSRLMHHISTLPQGFMDSIGSGKLRKIVNECSSATETFLAHHLPDKALGVATPLGLVIMLLAFDWRIGLLCIATIVVAYAIMLIFMTGPVLKKAMAEYQSALDNMSNEAVEYVRGIPVVKVFGQSVFSFHHFKEAIDRYGEWAIAYTKRLRFPMSLYTVVVNSIFAVLVGCALVMTRNGVTNEFLLNLLYYITITPVITISLNKLMFASEESMTVRNSLEKIDGVFALKPLSEPKEPKQPKDNSIEIDNVHFSYERTDKEVIKGISMIIRPGEHVAFVGPSGGGKTTLASLVSRFWDVSTGIIRIGGVDVRDIARDRITETVSFVFQDSHLIKGSILDNVRMAKPEASREEVLGVLHDAQCDDIIAKLPEGIDTVIGTDGVYLSGGETQRIAIARVMLRNTSVLILDEATAFADPDNESRVQKAFAKMSEGRTVIMIVHRLTTVEHADRIFVLNDGTVAESGTHSELMSRGGLYERMRNEYDRSINWKLN